MRTFRVTGPAPKFTPEQIVKLREERKLSRPLFARLLNVSRCNSEQVGVLVNANRVGRGTTSLEVMRGAPMPAYPVLRTRRASSAGTYGEMMMVIATRKEERPGIVRLSYSQAEATSIGIHFAEIAYLQMQMPDAEPADAVQICLAFEQDAAERQSPADHLDLIAVPGTFIRGFVPC